MNKNIERFILLTILLLFIIISFNQAFASGISFLIKDTNLVETSNDYITKLKPIDIDMFLQLKLRVKFDSSDPIINTNNQKRIILKNDSSWVSWEDVSVNAGYGVVKTCDLGIDARTLQFTGIDTLHFLAQVIKDGNVVKEKKFQLIIPFLPYIEPEPKYTHGDTNIVYWHRSKGMYDQFITIDEKVDQRISSNVLEGWTDPMVTIFQQLTDGKTYKYQIAGVSALDGRKIYSRAEYSTQDNLPPAPCNSLKVWSVDGREAHLSWSPVGDYNSGSGVAYYKIIAFESEDGTVSTSENSIKNTGDTSFVYVKSIDPEENYFFEVHAVDSVGNEGSGKRSGIVRFIQKPEYCQSNIDYEMKNHSTYSSLISTDSGYVKQLKLTFNILNVSVIPDSFRVEIARDSLKFMGTNYGRKSKQYLDFGWRQFSELKKSTDDCLYFNSNLGEDVNWINNHKYHFKTTYKDKYDNYSESNILTITRIDIVPPALIELNHVWTEKDNRGKPVIEISWYEGKDEESGLKNYFYYRKIGEKGDYKRVDFDTHKIRTHIRPSGRKAYYYQESYDSIGTNEIVYYKIGAVDNVGNVLNEVDIPNQSNYEMSVRCFYPPTLSLTDSTGFEISGDTLRCEGSKKGVTFDSLAIRWNAKNKSTISKILFNIQKLNGNSTRAILVTQDTVHVPIDFLSGILRVNAQFKYNNLLELSGQSNPIIVKYMFRPHIDTLSYDSDNQQLKIKWHGPNIPDSLKKYIVQIYKAENSNGINPEKDSPYRAWEGYGNEKIFGSIPPLELGYYYFGFVKAVINGDSTIWSKVDSCEAAAPNICENLPRIKSEDIFISDLPLKEGVYLNWQRYEGENKEELSKFKKIIYKIKRDSLFWWSYGAFFKDSLVQRNGKYFYSIIPAIITLNVPPDTILCLGATTSLLTNYEDLTFIPKVDSAEYNSTNFSVKENDNYYFKSGVLPVYWKQRHADPCKYEKYYGLDRLIVEASNNPDFEDNIYKNKLIVRDTILSLQDSLKQPFPVVAIRDLQLLSGDKLFLGLSGLDPWGNPHTVFWSKTFEMIKDAVPPKTTPVTVKTVTADTNTSNVIDFVFSWKRPKDDQSGIKKYKIVLKYKNTDTDSFFCDIGKDSGGVVFDSLIYQYISGSASDSVISDSVIIKNIKVDSSSIHSSLFTFNLFPIDAIGNIQKFNRPCHTPNLFLAPVFTFADTIKGGDFYRFCWTKNINAISYKLRYVNNDSFLYVSSLNDTTLDDTCYDITREKLATSKDWFFIVKTILPYGETGWSKYISISTSTNNGGKGQLLSRVFISETPKDYALKQNYPNPFNPRTVIAYQLPIPSEVELSIYNVLGKRINVLVKEKQPAGYHYVFWYGKDQFDNPVPSGIYFYVIRAGSFVAKKRCLLLK